MITVSPVTATAFPNRAPASASEASSLLCSVQLPFERVKTYAEPASAPPV